jgi:hypothetical protein
MKLSTASCFLLLALTAFVGAAQKTRPAHSRHVTSLNNSSSTNRLENIFDLRDYGAIGDGIADDGPALQAALDAIGNAGGGTLFVAAGRYAIYTAVRKDFTGLANEVALVGVESLTPAPPVNSDGLTLSRGLDLTSEFAPRTGEQGNALSISGLRNFLIKDITFIGAPDVVSDALITLSLHAIDSATIRHCEFYGLSTQIGQAIILSERSGLTIKQSAFLGTTANSGIYGSVVENVEWKSIAISETVFVDYGQRPELFSKTGLSAPFAWINIGNAAALTNDSPRREVTIRNVFLDEGGLNGISSLPAGYDPPSAPIDLVYISGLYMNVSNLGTSGNYLSDLRNVLVENSHYGWSQNADSAINLVGAGNAILDQLDCSAGANRIRADETTERLTVINSVYTYLDSLAATTRVITTPTTEEDPVQYVRQQFNSVAGHDPDAAAHFYWSDRLLRCDEDAGCLNAERAALEAYLRTAPAPAFSISGTITDESDDPLPGVLVTLSGSQAAVAQTDADGRYVFQKLPTSGIYKVIPDRSHHTFDTPELTITTPASDVIADFSASHNGYAIRGSVLDAAGERIPNVLVTLSGTATLSMLTDASGNYSFNATSLGDYTVTPTRANYSFSPAAASFTNLAGEQTADFTGKRFLFTISGRVIADDVGLGGVSVSLSGSQSATTTTTAGGAWSFTVAAEGDYTVTPSRLNYTFSSASESFTNLSGDETANFTGTLVNLTLSGRVTVGGVALSDVSVDLSGSQYATMTTAEDGSWSFTVPAEGDYTVTPSRVNYSFSPAVANFTNLSRNETTNFVGGLVSYTISGRATLGGDALAGASINLSGSKSGTMTTGIDGAWSFVVPAEGDYTVTPAEQDFLFSPVSRIFTHLASNEQGDFAGTWQKLIQFSATSYNTSENFRTITVTVSRTGNTSEAASVIYSAVDGSAQQRSDVIPIVGQLKFEAGETSKTFRVFVTDDSYVEGDESLTLSLSYPVGGTIGGKSSATLTIADNDTNATAPNAVDDAQFFVRQQYRDFLNRPPDAEGLAFWSNQILACGGDAACIEDRRINVSAAFFLSIEFQETGFLVYRLYQAAYAHPPQHVDEFLLDTRTIGEGVVVSKLGWQDLLAANKSSFIKAFVNRSQFEEAYPLTLTPSQFVTRLNSQAGNSFTASEVSAAIAEFGGTTGSENIDVRARILLRLAQSQSFSQRQTNPAFVMMQYFGYLQRNPDELPDTNLDGYEFWLHKLESFSGDFRRAEMVKAFLVSAEYRSRFGAP